MTSSYLSYDCFSRVDLSLFDKMSSQLTQFDAMILEHVQNKWLRVDESKFKRYKMLYEEIGHAYAEWILKFNHVTNTSFIDLGQVFRDINLSKSEDLELLHVKKSLLVDMIMLNNLNRSCVINWLSSTAYLYPIRTIGNGNCLCSAVMSYMTGIQDTHLNLRNALQAFVNSPSFKYDLKTRWLENRLSMSQRNPNLRVEKISLEREWLEILNLNTDMNNNTKNSNNDHIYMNSIDQDKLVYLEDIHVFALANLLSRPIIVLGDPFYKDIEENSMAGIYLPLLINPKSCVKSPVVLAYHNHHFAPLAFAMNYSTFQNSKVSSNDTYSSHTNAVCMSNGPLIKINHSDLSLNFANIEHFGQTLLPARLYQQSLEESLLHKRYYNVLPLHNSDLSELPIKFVYDSEKGLMGHYLAAYLSVRMLTINSQDVRFDCKGHSSKYPVKIKACLLTPNESYLNTNNNGISVYLKFLNKSIPKRKRSRSVAERVVNFHDEIDCCARCCSAKTEEAGESLRPRSRLKSVASHKRSKSESQSIRFEDERFARSHVNGQQVVNVESLNRIKLAVLCQGKECETVLGLVENGIFYPHTLAQDSELCDDCLLTNRLDQLRMDGMRTHC